VSLLSAGDLTAMRGVLDRSLPESCVIQGGTITSDSGGGGTLAWTNSGTVSCRVAPMRADEQVTGGRLSPDADWIITLPAETNISEESRIVTGGRTFEVDAVRSPRSFEVSCRVEVSEVT
jgi:head-tail adaptor